MYFLFGKRLADLFFAFFASLILSPILLLFSVLILVTDPGPVLFVHKRVGKNAKLFDFYKFRSMPVGTPKVSSDKLVDVKLTLFGRFIRRTSIDELPQLFNILRGDMSFVGPRPSLPDQLELIALRQESGALRLLPGLTGLAQVRSYDNMSVNQKAFFDAVYFHNLSFFADFSIVFKTMLYLLKSPPTY